MGLYEDYLAAMPSASDLPTLDSIMGTGGDAIEQPIEDVPMITQPGQSDEAWAVQDPDQWNNSQGVQARTDTYEGGLGDLGSYGDSFLKKTSPRADRSTMRGDEIEELLRQAFTGDYKEDTGYGMRDRSRKGRQQADYRRMLQQL